MEITLIQKKKHLLLLNRIMRAELKKDIIPTPSKLPEADVNSFFSKLFVKKDDYYIPLKNKMEIKIDEELFKGLIKKPKMKTEKPVEKKEVEKPKEVERTKEESINEFYNVFKLYAVDYIFENLSSVYNTMKTKDSIPFKTLQYTYRDKGLKAFDEISFQKAILNHLLQINKLNMFLDSMKNYKQKKDEIEKTKKDEEERKTNDENEKKFYKALKKYNPDALYIAIQDVEPDVPESKRSDFYKSLKFFVRGNDKWYKNKPFQVALLKELIKSNKLNEFFETLKEIDEFHEEPRTISKR
jgi:hypothetical protein